MRLLINTYWLLRENPIGEYNRKRRKQTSGPRDMIMVSNENGEVTFNVNETGEYNLQIITPEAQGKALVSKV